MANSITNAELEHLWDRFAAIMFPPRTWPPPPRPVPPHEFRHSKWWREGVEIYPGQEAYPGCAECGRAEDKH